MFNEPGPCNHCSIIGRHKSIDCPNFRCRYCNATGHIITDCLKVPPCAKCQKKGHRSENCTGRLTRPPTVKIGPNNPSRVQQGEAMRQGRPPETQPQNATPILRPPSTRSRSASPTGTRSTFEPNTSENGSKEAGCKGDSETGTAISVNSHDPCDDASAEPSTEEQEEK